MEIKILEQRANPLLHRTEIRFEVEHGSAATPSRDAVRAEIAKLVKAPKDRVVVERMHARFGLAHSRGEVMVYDSVEVAKSIVRAHIQVRNGLMEKAAKAEAAPAAPEAPKSEPAKPEAPAAKEA